MKTYKIAIIAGDGIGPEVINEGLKVLAKVSKKYKFKIETTHFDYGGGRYLKTSETLSDAEIQNLRNFDAILLGGIGHPDVKPGILERGILLKLRFDLDLYVNLRPVRLYENVKTPLKGKRPKDIDYIVFRENTGDLYTGVGEFQNKGTDKEIAIQQMIYSKHQVERCLRYAFEYLRNRHKNNYQNQSHVHQRRDVDVTHEVVATRVGAGHQRCPSAACNEPSTLWRKASA